MMRNPNRVIVVVIMLVTGSGVFARARISRIKGDVKVRQGFEETWSPAKTGLWLEDLDTIISGEASEVELHLDGNLTFLLGSRSILDIGDLRKITEKELFILLMSQKVGKIPPAQSGAPVTITNVSVVRGAQAESPSDTAVQVPSENLGLLEFNGAKALYYHRLYTNAIVKFYKIEQRYPDDVNENLHVMLGRSFEQINEPGRALDHYQQALTFLNNDSDDAQRNEILDSISRIKSEENVVGE